MGYCVYKGKEDMRYQYFKVFKKNIDISQSLTRKEIIKELEELDCVKNRNKSKNHMEYYDPLEILKRLREGDRFQTKDVWYECEIDWN